MKIFFKGFNYSEDGPGNRLVYHLQGCNMHCPWCSNPEGMPFDGGYDCSTAQIVRECVRSRAMFFAGGGVTFTGGEATVQWKELLDVLRQLRAEGIHTAIETNGTSPHLLEVQAYVDYLIMDFKHYDGDAFFKLTGEGIDALLHNYERLCAIKRQLHVRIPLINGINADDPRAFASYFARFDHSNAVFEFLPYHEYGKEKWKTAYTVTNGFVSSEQIASFEDTFASYHLKVIKT